ncbi:hypothetical protein Tco_0416935 [Tanacetum coccineum]
MSSLDRSNTTISDLYKGLDVITQLLKDIHNECQDGPLPTNQKLNEATKTFARIFSNITKVLSLVKGFDFSALLSTMKDLQAHALKQQEAPAAWTKSSTNMAWNLGTRILPLKSLKLLLNVNSLATSRIDKGKGIATESDEDPLKRLDKEEKMKKATEEAKLLAMSRPKVIKVVQEVAKKIRLDLRKIASAKAGKKFKKTKDAEHEVLKREHSKKVKRLTELNKRRAKEYMWTMTNRIKPKPITDVRIHPNTKPIVASVFRNNDKRNFDVHQPFKFSDFGITELDELGPIIQKKKNSVVKDLMTSLSKRYERLKKIPEELGIQSALPAPVPEQASSQTSGRKRKHMELEPEVKVPRLECNRSLPEGVPFVNNMVIEEPEYGIFFTDVFGDQAF